MNLFIVRNNLFSLCKVDVLMRWRVRSQWIYTLKTPYVQSTASLLSNFVHNYRETNGGNAYFFINIQRNFYLVLGEAAAILAKANTRLKSSLFVAKSLKKQYGIDAASLVIAEHYANAFSKLAKTGNTVLLPTKWKIYQVWLIKQ
ncbi:uncharacterized protein LOC143240742 isoform X3 [Tachypleus tridentatus]|uniref:uncharacterized protein LOC143240742 isoform X3 n=1 Tax=Tachypleus tridentatus TaxID=6853 RepID=UPI003FD4F1B5